MVKKDELLRLKNGFYLITSRFRKGGVDYPYEQIANLLYGPSYVSLEWALSYYNMIPERVGVVTSVTTGSHKNFTTPIGTFTYQRLPKTRYSVGIDHKTIEGQVGGFLIATPEKALADWVHLTCRSMNHDELLTDLTEAKRIEKETLENLNKPLMREIAAHCQSEIITTLAEII